MTIHITPRIGFACKWINDPSEVGGMKVNAKDRELNGRSTTMRPDYHALLSQGRKKQKLRAHSDFFWNQATNQWAAEFNKQFDIMCEAKGKNLASFAFAQSMRQTQA